MVAKAIESVKFLEKMRINVKAINIPTIKPLDEELIIKTSKETGKIITVEEHNVIGGLDSVVSELLFQIHPVKMKITGVNDRFGKSGSPELLHQGYGLTVENIVESVRKI